MNRFYCDYYWKNGRPQGINPKDHCEKVSYKLISDPYFKRTSIEKYSNGLFEKVIYDSLFLNFRHLKQEEQLAWEKTVIYETAEEQKNLIRDQNDRLIFKEHYRFKNGLTDVCEIYSTHNIHLSTHRMFYEHLGDPYNGVFLYDTNERPVMYKLYKWNGEFTDLIEENWDMNQFVTGGFNKS